jgi:hypothetical protein
MRRIVAFTAALALVPPASAAELTANLSVAPELATENSTSPYYVGPPTVPQRSRDSRQDLQLRLREGGFNAQGILRWQVAEGQQAERHGILNQVYYDGELGQGMGWTVGRKVVSWGVGFGFRPLDVVQREDRRGVNPPPLVGVPLVAFEHFTAEDAWTLAWTRPGEGRGVEQRTGSGRDEALALHWYRLAGSDDLHAVARLSRNRGLEAGFGATRIVGEEWSIHGAALYQRRYNQYVNSLAEQGGVLAVSDPTTIIAQRHGLKAVLGGQWTDASGWSVLAEAWYDADAYSLAEWRRLDALTASQRAMVGLVPATVIAGNVAWSSQAYQVTNLLRENLLLRLAYDEEGFKPYAEVLVTPRDRGRVVTVGASYEGNRQQFSGGLRQLGGAADSVYARAPMKRIVWFEYRIAIL